ncbi:NRDE family protein [Actinomadura xylanilytica]|uniref:NRDE family protein n=1 Tax=Actinomadura xylanilytica TaxID=887459 RepID=UPI00255AF5AC|nr:NRDE family protein [Actinomadura xylanilytica]MDL4777047.1 NRDE family protein [Actinomadura xylanilytica]
MCTAIVSVDPSAPVPVLLAGVRDEFIARPWEPPGRHWPDRPGLVGGRDLRAGGTWLAVDPDAPRASTVLNGHGRLAPEAGRRSRGGLPLRVAAEGKLGELELPRFDPFHLIGAEPDHVRLWSWDGEELAERELGPGLHIVVNSGLEGEHRDPAAPEDEHIAARLEHFRPRFEAAARPDPGRGDSPARAWDGWLDLLGGGGVPRADRRSLLPVLDLGGGRVWGTTSIGLVALSADGVRYDFSAAPGNPAAWTVIL